MSLWLRLSWHWTSLTSCLGRREITWHDDADINISTLVVVWGRKFELDILINTELNIIFALRTIAAAELKTTIAAFGLITMRVTNDIFEEETFLMITMIRNILFAEVLVFVVHWLLTNLVEVVWVKFQSAHLLTFRQMMSMIHKVLILMLWVRSEVIRLFLSYWHSILHHLPLSLIVKHVIFTLVLLPEISISFGKLLELSFVVNGFMWHCIYLWTLIVVKFIVALITIVTIVILFIIIEFFIIV